MAESLGTGVRPADPVGRVLDRLSLWLAYLGGVLLTCVALLTVVSVLRRWLLGRPVPGDYELAAMGTAIVVFAFLPLCQIRRGNIIVDVFTLGAPPRLKAALDAVGSLLFTAFAGVLAWQMHLGMLDRIPDPENWRYGETTMVLQLQIWPAFVPILASLGLLTLVCLYTLWRDLRRVAS